MLLLRPRPVQPQLYNTCFLPLPFFLPVCASSVSSTAGGLVAEPPAPHALAAGAVLCTRPIPRPVYPGVKIVVVGFWALGRAGKAPAAGSFAVLFVLEGAALDLADAGADISHDGVGAGPARAAGPGMRFDIADALFEEADTGGNILPLVAEPQLPLLLTALRLLCCVELFSFSTLDAPIPAPKIPAAVELDDAGPLGPGRDG